MPIELVEAAPARSRRSKASATPSVRSRRRNSRSPSSASGRRRAACAALPRSSPIGLFVVLLMLAWRLTPLAALTNPHTIQRVVRRHRGRAGGACDRARRSLSSAGCWCFRSRCLIAATAATFGPWLGFAYAAVGAAASAIVDLRRRRADRTASARRRARAAAQPHPPRPSPAAACSRWRPCGWCRSRRSRWSTWRPGASRIPLCGLRARHHPRDAAGPRADVGARPPDLQRADRADTAQCRTVRAGGDRLDRRIARDPGAGDLRSRRRKA